jgi:hypothetical protein
LAILLPSTPDLRRLWNCDYLDPFVALRPSAIVMGFVEPTQCNGQKFADWRQRCAKIYRAARDTAAK